MKIQRFYIENKIEDKSTIRVVSRELVNQLRNVFRLKSNDMVILFDNSGFDYVSCIKDYEDDIVIFSIVEKKINTNFLSKNIYLISSIIKKDKYEFEMLYGIRPSLQEKLASEDYNVRVYLPYGEEWFSYVYRRIRERKENLFFVLKHLFKK